MSAQSLKDDDQLSKAVFWLGRRRSGEMTRGDEIAFEEWLAEDVWNEVTYREVEDVWTLAGDVEEEPTVLEARDEDDRVLAARLRARMLAPLAAGLVLALVGGWILTSAGVLPSFSFFKSAPPHTYATLVGQRSTIALEDGSIVVLDTDSLLRTQFAGGERRLTLERGQASFRVAKDRHRPFIVAAAGKTVRATGTVFDVRVEPGRLAVTLIEGRVRVQEAGSRRDDAPMTDMRPGWRLAIGQDARWRMEPVDLLKVTSWHEGMLMFHADPIEVAVAEMNRYSHRKIVFRGAPPSKSVLGSFKAGDVESFARAMEMNHIARIAEKNDDVIELAAR